MDTEFAGKVMTMQTKRRLYLFWSEIYEEFCRVLEKNCINDGDTACGFCVTSRAGLTQSAFVAVNSQCECQFPCHFLL